MTDLSPEELRAILQKLDDVCRQAHELQIQIDAKMMVNGAAADHPPRSAAPAQELEMRKESR